MNQLQIFKNPQFGQIRVVETNGKYYAVGVDVARALEYARPSQAVIDHCKGIRKLGIPSEGGIQETNIIPEGDIYRLIVKAADQSKNLEIKTKAEKFESWIFDEVLPSIRKHGMYAKDELLDNPDLLLDVITRLKEEREQNKLLQTENKLLTQKTLAWADRKVIEALVKKYGAKIGYKEAWREFKKELLYAHGINLNLRITNWRNEHSRKTGPKTLDMIHDEEIEACISTAVALCKNNEIAINDVIQKFSKEAV